MGVRIKLKTQNLHIRVLSYCLVSVPSHLCADGLTCSTYVAHLYCFKLYVSFSSCMFLVSSPCCYCSNFLVLPLQKIPTNQPTTPHTSLYWFCLSFKLFSNFSNLMLNNKVAQSRNTALFRFLTFCVREMIVESYWIFSNFRCFATVLWFLLYKISNPVRLETPTNC